MTSVVLRNIARNRCCSFCYQPGHRINNCNDPRINDFEALCQQKKLEFEEELNQTNESEHIIINFRIWLSIQGNLNASIYKAFAVSRCGASLSDNQHVVLDKIIDYFNVPPLVDYNEHEELPDLIDVENNIVIPRQFPLTRGLGNLDFVPFDLRNLFGWHSTFLNENQNQNQLNVRTEVFEEEVMPENINKNLYTQIECSICYDTKDHYEFVNLPCSHEFCNKCIIETMEMCRTSHKDPFCGLCRASFEIIKTRSEEVKANIDNWLETHNSNQIQMFEFERQREEELNEYYISHRPERYF